MISRTLNWLSRYLDLTAEEQIIPRKLESIRPVLSIDVDYFWETAGRTIQQVIPFDHSAGSATQVIIPFKPDLDTLLIDWTWINLGGAVSYFINWDLVDIEGTDQTTLFRDQVNGTLTPTIVTRSDNKPAQPRLINNLGILQPRVIRSTEQLIWFVDDGGAGATANTLTIRTVEFPKNGPIPRLAV